MENEDKIKFELEKSLELRNFEINNFWKRGWFFGALLLFLFTAIIKINDDLISVSLGLMTFLISLSQTLINRGSKYWQERWEFKVKNREVALDIDITRTERYENKEHDYINASIYSKGENMLSRAKRFSVSKIAIFVWDLIVIFCFFYWISEILKFWELEVNKQYSFWIFHGSIIIYILLFFIKSSFSESTKSNLKFKRKKERLKNATLQSKDYLSNKLNEIDV